MPDPAGKEFTFVNGKSSGCSDRLPCSFKGIDGHSLGECHAAGDFAGREARMSSLSPRSERRANSGRRIDGSNKVKIASSKSLATGTWAPDNFHLFFHGRGDRTGKIISSEPMVAAFTRFPGTDGVTSVWSPDQKSIYVNSFGPGSLVRDDLERERGRFESGEDHEQMRSLLRMLTPEASICLAAILGAKGLEFTRCPSRIGNAPRCCPGVVTFGINMARDDKSFLYAVASRCDVTIYRQPWNDGKLIGSTQVALKLPFAFPLLRRRQCLRFFAAISRPSSMPVPAARPTYIF